LPVFVTNGETMPRKKKTDKISGQKKTYEVLDGPTMGKASKDEEIPFFACDRKRCLNGRCGACWLVILGASFAVGFCAILMIAGVLGFDFDTDGSDTLSEELCDSCTYEPTSNPTSAPTAEPTSNPTATPTLAPSADPTVDPTTDPTAVPTTEPTSNPTSMPTVEPTKAPTDAPTLDPTLDPTSPTYEPTSAPTDLPTSNPTSEPTTAPTADPTSERRLIYDSKATPNVLLVISDSVGFDTHGVNSKFDDFLKESYTFNNLQSQLTWGSLMTGKMIPVQDDESREGGHSQINGVTLVEKLMRKGYKNYYYGTWMWDAAIDSWKSFWHGWDFFYGTIDHRNQIAESVQTTLAKHVDTAWYMTVSLTTPNLDADLGIQEMKPDVYDVCSPYFLVGSTDFDYARGVSCQWSMENDEMFGQVLEIIKSAEQWEHTVVVLIDMGEQEPMFSIGGGALPAELISRINEDTHSFLDIAPTILSIAGFSDSELEVGNLEGVDVLMKM